ncbi:MAG: glycosyltransferase, partial [Clostridia bacterium]|nr:glycosyltransferase [Clostridia bacterium]
ILCGYRHATGDCVMEMDVDLQDPVELIPEMVEKWKEGYDVVHGRRIKRKGETVFKKATAKLYYKFLDKISAVSIPRDTGDFKLYDKKVIEIITGMGEKNKYIRGLASWVGFKQTFVDFERKERSAGETKYTLKKMVALAKTGILSNSAWPLSLSLKAGLFGVVSAMLCFVTFIVLACCQIVLPLTAWLFPTLALGFGALALFNGISNLYIEKINAEVQNRPEYIVAEKINLER